MKVNFWEILLGTEDECSSMISIHHVRVGALLGFFMYSMFGVLDWFLLPQTYQFAWLLRFGVIAPLCVLLYVFSFWEKFNRKYAKMWLSLLAILAQLGIVAMIYNARPAEGAYFSYYGGLITVIFWSLVIFRLSLPEIILISVANVVFYNIIALGIQKLQYYPENSMEFASLINNNFFLVSASFLSILGAFQLNSYKKKLIAHNQVINNEKKELFKAKKKAEESDQLKSAFLANMSHEIRTPMNAVLGFTELLKNPAISEDRKAEFLQILQSKSHQLLRLIDDIVDISKIETNNMKICREPVNLNLLVGELEKTYVRILQRNGKGGGLTLRFVKAFTDDESWIMADDTRLKQVISNLVDNALKFTGKGEITVSYILNESKKLQFLVKDTGIGIPADKLPVIFDRFRQVDHQKGGTGLGLSIVKSLVEMCGGEIWVKSELNIGSRFYFTLPYVAVDKGKEGQRHMFPYTRNVNWKGKVILVAEDDPDNYLVLKEFLEPTGVTLLWAQNGNEVLEIALGNDKIDLVLMDIKLPGINGYEAARQIKRRKRHIPIIAQTAYAMGGDREKALEAKCDDYIPKPIDFNRLIAMVDRFLS
jgi:signal transduction histidine kinase